MRRLLFRIDTSGALKNRRVKNRIRPRYRNVIGKLALLLTLFALMTNQLAAAPPRAITRPHAQTSFGPPASRIFQAVPNVFATARGKQLTDADLDGYIAPSVTGADRVLAHKIMAFMPINQRGDFVYSSLSHHLVTNNPALLPYITLSVRRRPTHMSLSGTRRPYTNGFGIQPLTVTQCSPPNPPTGGTGAGGPYLRQVSFCGFTSAFGFVNVPCGFTSFNNSDRGFLYFELQGASGSETEGGLQYNSDTSVQPHLVSTTRGDLTNDMNNSAAHYGCGMNLGIGHGATSDGSMTYTEVGVLPSDLTPQFVFYSGQEFSLQNAAWLFYQQPGDISGAGTDNLGEPTPCTQCSISQVTSIGQADQYTYSQDGSYFGVDLSASPQANMINWMQVAFGEWQSNCMPGTSLCTFQYSSDPTAYYQGEENYPNNQISESNLNVPSYGPYESYDGINLTGSSGFAVPSATFREPLPPLACAPDSHGYCAVTTYSSFSGPYRCKLDGNTVYYSTQTTYYAVYNGRPFKEKATHVLQERGCPVQFTSFWAAPGNPSVQYGDPNLP